ncbi:hypothetical protein MY10362_009099 [Beauveria mimosiformis]
MSIQSVHTAKPRPANRWPSRQRVEERCGWWWVVVVVVVVAVADQSAAIKDADEGKGEPRERRKGRQRCSHQYLSGFGLGPAPGAADDVGRVLWNPGGGENGHDAKQQEKAYYAHTTTSAPLWPLWRAHLRALLHGVGLAAVRRRRRRRRRRVSALRVVFRSSRILVRRPPSSLCFRLVEREPERLPA